MLVFSAIVPHPPILIPALGQENLNLLKKTTEAMEKTAEKLFSQISDVFYVCGYTDGAGGFDLSKN